MSALKKAFEDIKEKVKPSGNQSDDEVGRVRRRHGSLSVVNSSRQSIDSPATSIRSARTSMESSSYSQARNPTLQTTHTHTPSPVRFMREKFRIGESPSRRSNDETLLNQDGEEMSKGQQRKLEKQEEAERKRLAAEERELELALRKKEIAERAALEETAEQSARYGFLPANNYAQTRVHVDRDSIGQLSLAVVGRRLFFRARLHHIRAVGSKLVFLVFRQRTATIQGVLQVSDIIPPHMVYWVEHLPVESIVLVRGKVQEAKSKQGEVIGATVKEVEILIESLHVESRVTDHLPFTVHEAEITRQEAEDESSNRQHVGDRARLLSRVVDLRTSPAQGIFRIQSAICHLFRAHLDTQGFVEIHTPKLQGGATESGASVFKLDYFGRPAFLAQSPQLAKQMMISADFGRVYEIGPVFRAENSNTHRHLTEFTGMDLEMEIEEHYHEVLRMLDSTFKHIFEGIYQNHRRELEIVKRHFPHDDLVWLPETPVIPFAQAIQMLNDSGWRDEHGQPLPVDEDLGTRDEMQLGRLIKQVYGTDYYILDKFPASARPFYTMSDPDNPEITNSFDIFLRGQEILSGGQRIHDAEMLLERMERLKVDPRVMEEYVDAFNWGAPPHGGGGIGLERLLMLFLNLGDVRHASLFPRDPRSLPAKPPVKQLRHPEASTLHPPWEGRDRAAAPEDLQPIEKLIANYGDASNTSWLEPRTEIWRDHYTGAAVGFVPMDSYAIIVGDPLCDVSQYTRTISGFLRYIKQERRLKPIWLLVGHEVEDVLASRFNWRTFSVTAEQRLDPTRAASPTNHDSDVQRKIRHAEREGIRIMDIPLGGSVPEDVQERIEGRVADWQAARKGKQVHLTEIRPWQDVEHRSYHYAVDRTGTIVALVVLAQLSPEHGWQVKFSLDFPGAPSGTIEYLLTHCLSLLAAQGVTSVTFGGGASADFTRGHNMSGTKVRVLKKMYTAIAAELKLNNKTEFRARFGAEEDPIYVCYPPHGLGPGGIKAIMNFFGEDNSQQ